MSRLISVAVTVALVISASAGMRAQPSNSRNSPQARSGKWSAMRTRHGNIWTSRRTFGRGSRRSNGRPNQRKLNGSAAARKLMVLLPNTRGRWTHQRTATSTSPTKPSRWLFRQSISKAFQQRASNESHDELSRAEGQSMNARGILLWP